MSNIRIDLLSDRLRETAQALCRAREARDAARDEMEQARGRVLAALRGFYREATEGELDEDLVAAPQRTASAERARS